MSIDGSENQGPPQTGPTPARAMAVSGFLVLLADEPMDTHILKISTQNEILNIKSISISFILLFLKRRAYCADVDTRNRNERRQAAANRIDRKTIE